MVHHQTQVLFPELRLPRMLAAALGGRLWLEREQGAGFTCCLSMPLTILPNPAAQPDDGSTATGDPTDRLANLQLLAEKKKVPFHQEIDRYLSELTHELHHLETAIKAEQDTATYYAHLLCGRFSFIFERKLEQRLREMEDLVTGQRWAEARRCYAELPVLMQDLHTRITTAAPIVRPE